MTTDMELDPEVAELVAASPYAAFDLGVLDPSMLPTLREMMAGMFFASEAAGIAHRDVTVSAGTEGTSVPVRVYTPERPGQDRACLLWFHGGAFALGTPLMDEARIDRWVDENDCVAVSVDYRLAPEHPFPAPLDDCYTALAWTVESAAELGIDPSRIVVSGESAGGCLAAGLALLARDRKEYGIRSQFLIYPTLDDRAETPASTMDAPLWTPAANVNGWTWYLGHDPGKPDVSPYAAPARATDLAGLPPAFVAVGTVDISRDDCIDYVTRLLAAGVAADLHLFSGAPHGLDVVAPTAALSVRFQRCIDEGLAQALA